MLISSCPGCKSNEFNFVGNIGKSIRITLDGQTFCQPDYQIKHCKNCGLYYKSNTVDNFELERYYSKADFLRYEHKVFFPTENAIIEILKKLPDGSNVLDYGCSTGRILSQVLDKHNCYGVEVNIAAREIAQQKGITIIQDVEVDATKDLRFDAILLSDVFEHLPYPTQTLDKLCSTLKSNGILIICTGNADAPACQLDIANFWYFRGLEHLSMISREYGNFLSSKLNLELRSWQEMCHYDFPVYQKIRQITQSFAYWQFKGSNPIVKGLLRLIPFLKRAEKWSEPPYLACTDDHVLAVFYKL